MEPPAARSVCTLQGTLLAPIRSVTTSRVFTPDGFTAQHCTYPQCRTHISQTQTHRAADEDLLTRVSDSDGGGDLIAVATSSTTVTPRHSTPLTASTVDRVRLSSSLTRTFYQATEYFGKQLPSPLIFHGKVSRNKLFENILACVKFFFLPAKSTFAKTATTNKSVYKSL